MRLTRHRRQILLFAVAILIPAAVLVGLAARMMYQDRELVAKREADQRRIATDQVRRELDARLESIKLQEINWLIRPANANPASDFDNPAVIFTARVEGDHLILPGEAPGSPESAAFVRRRQEGENEEFGKRDMAGAAAAYRLALASAGSPSESAEARLLLARALSKTDKPAEAYLLYQTLLNAPGDARDEQGVGYRFYAAERLLAARREPATVLSLLRNEIDGKGRLTLPELYLIRSFPEMQSEPRIAERIAEVERRTALAKDFPLVRARIESSAAPSGSAWVPYTPPSSGELWLVTLTSSQPPLPGLVIAVSSTKVAPPGVELRTRVSGAPVLADALGEEFPGLYVEWSGKRTLETGHEALLIGIWMAALALVLGIALFGGYLLLRDVNRDVRMTEVRSQFVASVSHELKTPLTAIRMFAETLAMGRARDEETKSEYLETIVNESERLARLVDNVLDFSKIEQGKKIYRLRPTRIDDVAGSAVRAMQFPLAQQGFQLRVSVEQDIPELQADPDAIQQAILNLLTNAMKYSGDSREIDLRLAARNGDAVIEVVDRGLGLAPEEQKRVFDKFYRAPSHEKHLIAGTGLGLTLVAHIATAHGGRVEVESAPGAGSTFSMFIPIKTPAPIRREHSVAPIHFEAGRAGPAPQRGAPVTTVLAIEDDPAILRGLSDNLRFEGYEVITAADGETGYRLQAERKPDLILLDLMLPRMNGLEFCRRLRREGIQTPVLMLTARSEEPDRVLGLDLGADDYVAKPFSVRELMARVRALLRRSQPGPEGSRVLPDELHFGEATIDFRSYEARRNGEPLEMTRKEFAILRYLASRAGEVVSRDDLLNEVWGYDSYPSSRTVDNHVAGLRAKLERDASQPEHIRTVHGVGYKFVP